MEGHQQMLSRKHTFSEEGISDGVKVCANASRHLDTILDCITLYITLMSSLRENNELWAGKYYIQNYFSMPFYIFISHHQQFPQNIDVHQTSLVYARIYLTIPAGGGGHWKLITFFQEALSPSNISLAVLSLSLGA